MVSQILDVKLKADTAEEYEKLKAFLAKANLPSLPDYNDLLREVTIHVTAPFPL